MSTKINEAAGTLGPIFVLDVSAAKKHIASLLRSGTVWPSTVLSYLRPDEFQSPTRFVTAYTLSPSMAAALDVWADGASIERTLDMNRNVVGKAALLGQLKLLDHIIYRLARATPPAMVLVARNFDLTNEWCESMRKAATL